LFDSLFSVYYSLVDALHRRLKTHVSQVAGLNMSFSFLFSRY